MGLNVDVYYLFCLLAASNATKINASPFVLVRVYYSCYG